MATTPTQDAVPSESPRDLKFNAGKIDEFVTSLALKYTDRFGGEHYTIEGLRWLAEQAIAKYGYITLDSFEDGNTITEPNQVLRWESNGEYYRWDGSLPKAVSPGSTPESTGGIQKGAWIAVGDAALRSEINSVTRQFATVAEMITKGGAVGQRLVTLGYYSAGDGGGAEYIIRSGTAAQDYSDAGSIQIDATKHAWLVQKDSYNFKQFGVKPEDGSFAQNNDTFIAYAIKRARSSKAMLYITDIIWHKAPIVIDYWTCIKGFSIGMDSASTPRFVKIDNTKSGLSPLGYPGVTDTVSYDVDASIIIKRQSAATDFVRGVTLEGFTLFSNQKSEFGIYSPHLADFSIDLDIRNFSTAFRGYVIFLGRLAGRFIGLSSDASISRTSIGVWLTSFSSIPDCGNSVTFRVSLNNFARGIQVENFGNGILERVTLEQIKRQAYPSSVLDPFGIYATNSWLYGAVSCESSTCCVIRAGNNANLEINLSSAFRLDQDSAAEGVVHSLAGGRILLRASTILANTAGTVVRNENAGYMDICSTSRFGNITFVNLDPYRFKNRTLNFGQTSTTGATSYPNGTEITFNGFTGIPNATTQSGIITFSSPALMRVTVSARGVSSGTMGFGLNGSLTESVSAGSDRTVVISVLQGDKLDIVATSATTLINNGGVRVILDPIL